MKRIAWPNVVNVAEAERLYVISGTTLKLSENLKCSKQGRAVKLAKLTRYPALNGER